MLPKSLQTCIFLCIFSTVFMNHALAETPQEVLSAIQANARESTSFKAFSAARGETFYRTKQGGDWSCSTCHTDNPAAQGKHAKTDKPIKPIAPSANGERFTDMKKVEKWFRRNCNDVLDRLCTAQEKGDFLTYLLTVK